MTVATEEAPATPADQLDQAEQESEAEIAVLIAGLVAAGVSAVAILALLAAFTGVVSRGAQTGWVIGAQIAVAGLTGPGQRVRRDRFRVEPLPTSVQQDVEAVVADGARRIEEVIRRDQAAEARPEGAGGATSTPEASGGGQGDPQSPGAPGQGPVGGVNTPGVERRQEVIEELRRFERRMVRLATTKIHQAASAATYSYATWLGLDLEWVTRRDGRACAVCTTMSGRRVAAGEKFTAPTGPGIPRRLWAGFQGLPPAHPNCRCRCLPRT